MTDQSFSTDSNRLLVSQFESLGDNCEFGFVQRYCGHEESGLFRWARIKNVEHLIGALECRFHGMFEYETMRPCDFGMLEDLGHPVQWHTARASEKREDGSFVCTLGPDEQTRIFAEERAKYEHLKRCFLERCCDGSKIFVYKMNDGITEEAARRLSRALRNLGPVACLIVRVAGDRHEACTVRTLQEALYVGQVSQFAAYRRADQPEMNGWLQLCRQVLDHRSSERAGSQPKGRRSVAETVRAARSNLRTRSLGAFMGFRSSGRSSGGLDGRRPGRLS